jgi:AmiR/NasT family two-component response regulator
MVMFPAIWEDLFCVKIIREISPMPTPFEMVMVDEKPDISNLIIAFNEGLSAYLETPFTKEKLQLTISRIRSRFEDKIAQLS